MSRTVGARTGANVPISRRVFAAVVGAVPLMLAACSGAAENTNHAGSTARGRRAHAAKHSHVARATWPQKAVKEVKSLVKPYAGNVSLVCTPLDAKSFAPRKGGFAIEPEDQRTAASLIKLVVLATALEAVTAGTCSLDDRVTVTRDDIVGGAGDIQAQGAGASYTIDELLHAMIAQSDNIAANLIIGKLGMEAVNDECAKLHLAQTELQRLMMDTAARRAGRENVTSAGDVATVLERIAANGIATPELCERARSYLLDQRDTAGIVQGLPDGTQVAHKTGSLDAVQHDAAIVYADRSYVLVVLTQGMEREAALDLMRGISTAVWHAAVS